MASAKKCDICGKLYERYNEERNAENPNAVQFVSDDSKGKYFAYGIIDCCPDCMKSILQHIERLEEKGRNNG